MTGTSDATGAGGATPSVGAPAPAPAQPGRGGRVRGGKVVAFDERRGRGELADDASGERFAFHCTRIAGGARRIRPGAAVAFEVGPGGPGRWEAVALREVAPAAAPARGGSGSGRGAG